MREDETVQFISSLPVKVYRRFGKTAGEESAEFVAKLRVYLEDRPGSLADFASLISRSRGNISFFHYDRSVHSNRVVAEVQLSEQRSLVALFNALQERQYVFRETRRMKEEVQITNIENVLEIKVRLENKPGTLSAFAVLLQAHNANIIFMLYNGDIDPESATIAMATSDLAEIDALLDAINREGYYYKVVYRGSEEREVEHIIGLKQVEKFYLKLRKLLAERDVNEIKSIVDSSQELYADLIQFYEEAGDFLETGDVFEKILALASKSRSRVSERFSAVEMPPVQITEQVRLFSFRLPTTENIYLFHHDDELTMIDCGYGVYYEDIKKLLKKKSLDPSKVKRIFLTHPDADHAGCSGYFAEEYGTEIFMHPLCKGAIEHTNRAHGTSGRLSNLNRYYTRLINKFTDCRFPAHPRYYPVSPAGTIGGFTVIDNFTIGSVAFEVLESHGGHIPGHVFFVSREHGLFFTSDFLINVKSLSPEDKDVLSVYRYLLTNPNSDSRLFSRESDALKDVIMALNRSFRQRGVDAIVFPGHGEYYQADAIDAVLMRKR